MVSRWTGADIDLLNQIYELQCTSRMNAIYYGKKLRLIQGISFWMEVSIAATASGSGLASIAWLKSSEAWQWLIFAAAAVAILRPIYAPAKKVEHLTRQQHGYAINYFSLKKLSMLVRQLEAINGESRRRFYLIFDRHTQLSSEDEPTATRWLLRRARKQTQEELPPSSFWWPDSTPSARTPVVPPDTNADTRVVPHIVR